jgi:mono/diheme cytochrome c family protein
VKKVSVVSTTATMTLLVVATITLTVTAAWAQFTQDKGSKIDVSSYPAEVQKDYGVYRTRCSSCHSLGPITRTLRAAPAQQRFWVAKMASMPSTDFSNEDAQHILTFLSYDAAHHAAASADNATTDPKVTGAIAAGRQFYKDQNCNVCHRVAGDGGNGGPALDNVGRALTSDQLTRKIMGMRAGSVSSMPPLPSTTTDEQIQALVAYLSSLKGSQ